MPASPFVTSPLSPFFGFIALCSCALFSLCWLCTRCTEQTLERLEADTLGCLLADALDHSSHEVVLEERGRVHVHTDNTSSTLFVRQCSVRTRRSSRTLQQHHRAPRAHPGRGPQSARHREGILRVGKASNQHTHQAGQASKSRNNGLLWARRWIRTMVDAASTGGGGW
ncbi:hypothetical protein PSEUBRA_000914 [Kalmanozyma brasiliensis GHG001]|uniref:uncharacterized protein n=1 Tax=Kalmanozyma brasiliensis (strain GHG001) TaxID=1365824 RepID=UPI001CE95F6C|nr:uncharacterized protein PSEUBRA_000914 [Kalmanozyma brasiliensis GHG001]KAF6766863.1 hypothetical protein PSEUBRA_000914 [Kalmanozyma brasiliensis GHG001]